MGFVILNVCADVSRNIVQNVAFMNFASEDSVQQNILCLSPPIMSEYNLQFVILCGYLPEVTACR